MSAMSIFSIKTRITISIMGILILGITYSCKKKPESIFAAIPFKIIKHQMVISVITNESDTSNFIFDTGNENAHLDSVLANKMGIFPYSEIYVRCSNSERVLPITRCLFKINNLERYTDTVILFSSKYASKILGIKINGIIGRDIFKNRIIKIDFINYTIKIFNLNAEPDIKDYQVFSSTRGPAIIAESKLQNGITLKGRYILDSGSNIDLTLAPFYLDSTAIKSYIGKYKSSYFKDPCGNRTKEYEGKLSSFMIGDFTIDSPVVSLSPSEKGVLAHNDYAGLVGLPTLQYFDIIIDDIHSKIYLKLNKRNKNK
jgi:hypothetical protein